MTYRVSVSLPFCLVAGLMMTAVAVAADDKKATPFEIGGKYVLTPPGAWDAVQPRSRIVEYEFEVPVAEGDEIPGRVTVMGAAGSIEDNIDRWKGQFKTPETGEVAADIKKSEVAGQEVIVVDIKGTYLDRVGPFVPGPATEREKYRMLGAIIVTKEDGQYFVKFYGPEKTVNANEAGFKAMLDGLKSK